MELDIEQLVNKIIPKNDREHREGFSNDIIIDQLDIATKRLIEDALIQKLSNGSHDALIVETLAYLKSVRSLPILYDLLDRPPYPMHRLVVTSSIYEINKDSNLVDLAIKVFNEMTNKYDIISAFYYLSKFNNVKANAIIGSYTNDKEYLISYNAKRFWIKP
ncbi:MAG: hypothetical protein JWR50_3994 [Mucilaginibacter sp.]|nr:hypothetical protein [Mucilaginibacter sp.]